MEADRRIAEIMEIAELKKQNVDLQQKWLEEGYEKAKLVEKIKLLENFIKINGWVEIELNKELKKLEEKISILLSCKNCPENKGGYICQKEYEDKCFAQKIQYIKELKEENAELKAQIEKMKDKLKSDLISKLKEEISYSTSPSCTKGMELFIKSIEKWEIKEND